MKMRLVDAIESWEPHRAIRGRKVASFEEYMLRGGLGYAEHLPESLALGSLVELAAWLTILSSDFTQIALPCELREVRFASTVGPAQRLELSLAQRLDGTQWVVDGRGVVGERLVLDVAGLRLATHALADFHDPADLRVLFSEIHRPTEGVAR